MAAPSISLTSPHFPFSQPHHHFSPYFLSPHYPHYQPYLLRSLPVLHASRRTDFTSSPESGDGRKWNRFGFDGYRDDDNVDYDDDEEDDDEEEEDRSLDLLVRFVENVFRKVSKRARKAVRSVLPVAISTKLVGFAVNGLLVLSFLWVLKAFLEVICTLGSVVFVSILLIRGVWSGVSYLQENRWHLNGYYDDHPAWNGAQPVS